MFLTKLGKSDRAFFKVARDISFLSDHPCRHGAVLVDGHKIISSGYNSQTRCSTIQKNIDDRFFNECCHRGTLHAEVDALLPFIRKHQSLPNAILYIYRENKLGETSLSKPCPRCMKIIKDLGIKKIKYTTENGFVVEKI